MLQRNLTLKLTLLSDLHIGTGASLIENLDWIERPDGFIYVADQVELNNLVVQRGLAEQNNIRFVVNKITGLGLRDLVQLGWLRNEDFQAPSKHFPYRLRGKPAMREVREQIKDVYLNPYLPGSSVKGALRTVIAGVAAAQLKPDVTPAALGRRREWAASPVEKALFGSDPTHDFLRLLQVSDSAAVDPAALRLRRAHIYPTAGETAYGRSKGLDIDLEVVAKDTEFELPIHMPLELLGDGQGNDQGFEQRRQTELADWEKRKPWLAKLAFAGKSYARQQLIEEVNYFQNRTDAPIVHGFYNRLVEQFSQLPKNQFLLRLGWGGGWHTKTISAYLRSDPDNLEAIIEQYRLNPMSKRRKGDPFPKSRHLLRQPDGQPGAPLGWVLAELNAVK